MRISHEAIYQAPFVQSRSASRRDLTACLRNGRILRVPQARVGQRGKAFVSDVIMISERPTEAEDRAVPGHWETFLTGMEVLTVRLGADQARIYREAIATDQALGDTAFYRCLEQPAQQIAIAEAAVPRLGKGRMVRHVAVQTQTTELTTG